MRLCLLSTCFMKPICQNMHENEVVPDQTKCLQHTLGVYKVSHIHLLLALLDTMCLGGIECVQPAV